MLHHGPKRAIEREKERKGIKTNKAFKIDGSLGEKSELKVTRRSTKCVSLK